MGCATVVVLALMLGAAWLVAVFHFVIKAWDWMDPWRRTTVHLMAAIIFTPSAAVAPIFIAYDLGVYSACDDPAPTETGGDHE